MVENTHSKQAIRMLVMDVDGTLTDGKIHMGKQEELFKSFDVKDGYGIRRILPQYQITPVIITGRISAIVGNRCKELGISHLYQGVEDKAKCLREVAEICRLPVNQVACIGDDENDLPMLNISGICGCPADAVNAVKRNCDYVCKLPGGYGAVREFIEWLLKENYST